MGRIGLKGMSYSNNLEPSIDGIDSCDPKVVFFYKLDGGEFWQELSECFLWVSRHHTKSD